MITLLKASKKIRFDDFRGNIRDCLPMVIDKNGKTIQQPRYNIYRNRQKDEKDKDIISGFPLKDNRHKRTT